MSQLSDVELQRFGYVADELREVFAERGHRVEQATGVDPAFGSGWSVSALTRDLVVDAVSSAASRVGLDFRPVKGGGREFRYLAGGVDRRFRLRRARRGAHGELVIAASPDSALVSTIDSLFVEEPWVFGWTISSDGEVEEVFLAEIVGYVDGRPGYLRLGNVLALGGGGLPSGGFHPTDEGLDGFDEPGVDEDFGS